MEEWKRSKKYEEYELSTEGRVRNAKTGKVLKTNIDKKGYEQVQIRKDNKSCTERVHRLMADTFMDDIPEGYDVYHENRNRSDNRLENLKYCSKSETSKRGFASGNRKGRERIRVHIYKIKNDGTKTCIREFDSLKDCANFLRVHESVISRCSNGLIYTCHGYHIDRI